MLLFLCSLIMELLSTTAFSEKMVKADDETILDFQMLEQGERNFSFEGYSAIKLYFPENDGVLVVFNNKGYQLSFHFGENDSDEITKENIFYFQNTGDYIMIRKSADDTSLGTTISDLQVSFRPDFRQDSTVGFVTTDPNAPFTMIPYATSDSINYTLKEGDIISFYNASPFPRLSFLEYFLDGIENATYDIGDGLGEQHYNESSYILLTDYHFSFYSHFTVVSLVDIPMILYSSISFSDINPQFTTNSANISSFESGPYPLSKIHSIYRAKRAFVCVGTKTCTDIPEGYELIPNELLTSALDTYSQQSGDMEASVIYGGSGVGIFNAKGFDGLDLTIECVSKDVIVDLDFSQGNMHTLHLKNTNIRQVITSENLQIISSQNIILENSLLKPSSSLSLSAANVVTDFYSIAYIASLTVKDSLEFTGYLPGDIEDGFKLKISVYFDSILTLPGSITDLYVYDDCIVSIKNQTTVLEIFAPNVALKGAPSVNIIGLMEYPDVLDPFTIKIYDSSTTVIGSFSQELLFIFSGINKLQLNTTINYVLEKYSYIETTLDTFLSKNWTSGPSTIATYTDSTIDSVELFNDGFIVHTVDNTTTFVSATNDLVLHHNSRTRTLHILYGEKTDNIPNLTIIAYDGCSIAFDQNWISYNGDDKITVSVSDKQNANIYALGYTVPPCVDVRASNGTLLNRYEYITTEKRPPTPKPSNKNKLIVIICSVLIAIIVVTAVVVLFATPVGELCGITTDRLCLKNKNPENDSDNLDNHLYSTDEI